MPLRAQEFADHVSPQIVGCLGTRSFCFFRQEFFDRKLKIKLRFFLVAFERDF